MNSIKNQKGQSLVEFAIILPIILLLLMGIAQFGMLLNSYLTLQNTTREGARLAIVGGSDIEINTLITSISPNLTPADLTVNITPTETSRSSGDNIVVNVSYNYHMTLPIISALFNNLIVLTSQTTMRME